jgi:hypothetical protein
MIMVARMPYVALACVVALVLCAAEAHGTASTHIWAPSTDVQPFKLVHITSDMYLPVEYDAAGNRLATVTNLGLTVGVLPFKTVNMEVGLDHKSGLGGLDDYPLYGNVKIGMPEGALGRVCPAGAIGVFDVGTKSDLTDFNVFYAKIAKSFAIDSVSLGRFSVGYFSGNEELLLRRDGTTDNEGVLLAWERTMNELSDRLWVCVEYMGTESIYGTFNVGASWKFAPNVALLAGYDVFNDDGLPGTATVQVDIDF